MAMNDKLSRLLVNRMIYMFNITRCAKLTLALLALVFYCEFLIYYVVLLRCAWPALSSKNLDILSNTVGRNPPIKMMVIADTHLLGYRTGHWFDKLRR